MPQQKSLTFILSIIVIAQFCCTSLWFASNGIMIDLLSVFGLPTTSIGHLTSAVQFGFITGTLIFALLNIADRFAPSKVFFVCAILGAITNWGTSWESNNLWSLISWRFFTGFFLSGIYPVGMKIAADYFEKGLGKSLSYLVGALVLGTAFPHLLKATDLGLGWKAVVLTTTSLAVMGGLLILLFVPDGPFRKASQKLNLSAFFEVFKVPPFRAAAFGYFGHMWELYAFWAFVPFILETYLDMHPGTDLNIAFWSFIIIAAGGLACVISGNISEYKGTKFTATVALAASGFCCLISPLAFYLEQNGIFLAFLVFWGMVVVADSPLFSTLVAQNAPPELKGTALTIVTCVGFAITIFSIQLLNGLTEKLAPTLLYLTLFAGPVFGLFSLRKKLRSV